MARFEYVMIFQLTIKQIKKDLFKSSTSPERKAGVLVWVCNFRAESIDFVSSTKNFCRSQNKFADIRKKLQEPVVQNCPGIVPL